MLEIAEFKRFVQVGERTAAGVTGEKVPFIEAANNENAHAGPEFTQLGEGSFAVEAGHQ